MPTPQEQHEAEMLATYLEALARTSLNAASSLRSLRDKGKGNYRLLHIRIGRVLEHAPPSEVCRQTERRPLALDALEAETPLAGYDALLEGDTRFCPPALPKADLSAARYIELVEQGTIPCPCSQMRTRR